MDTHGKHDDKHDHDKKPADQPTAEPATAKTVPANPGGAVRTHHADRIKDAVIEGIQSEFIRLFQENREKMAEWLLDRVPDAHTHTAETIAKFLPRAAQVFRIATPAGFIWDPLDDMVQDLAHAIKMISERRAGGNLTQASTHAPAQAAPQPHPVEPSPKRFFSFIALLDEGTEDDLRIWHDSLSAEDKTRLYVLSDQLGNSELTQLLSGNQKVLEDAVKLTKLPAKTLSFLKFREGVNKDAALAARVAAFLNALKVEPSHFWKMVERYHGNRVKDFEDFKLLMALTDKEIYNFLHLAEGLKDAWEEVIRLTNVCAQGISSGAGKLPGVVKDADHQLSLLGLQLQAMVPAPKQPRTRPSLYDRFINRLFN